jgi:hypothetical protein
MFYIPMWLRGDRIPSDRNNCDRIRQIFGRILFSRIPTPTLSEFDETRWKSDQIRPEFYRLLSNSDEIQVGIRLKGIRQKLSRVRSVFYGKCLIPMKSDAGPTENDRIYKSDWLSWDILIEKTILRWMSLFTMNSKRIIMVFHVKKWFLGRYKETQNFSCC